VEAIKASFLASPAFKANPYPFYARMRAEAPVFPVSIPFYARAWLITRYEDVAAMLKDARLSRDISARLPWQPRFTRPMFDNMLGREAPDHTRLRKLVSLAFTPRRIDTLRGLIESVCEERLAATPAGRPFDLVAGYALPIPLTIIAELLGIPRRDRPRFHRLSREGLRLGAPISVLDLARGLPYLWLLMHYFRQLLAERRLRPRDDLLSALVQAEEAGDRLSADEVLGTATLLLVAGYETTIHLIAGGALALLQHPDERARFMEDPGVAESAIEELLRYTSPVEMTPPRVALDDVSFASVTIPKGSFVSGVLGSANHDASAFREPERLDLGRTPNKHLALGFGHHFCLGASLARMEARIALTTLFRRWPAVRLALPAESLRWRRVLPLRGLVTLPVMSR
jgi:cytochrome P450 PksS